MLMRRYQLKSPRLYEVLNSRLVNRTWLADNFSIADILSFPNGEKSWHGESYSNHGIRTISMTAGHNYFLASVITPENSYKVIAKKTK